MQYDLAATLKTSSSKLDYLSAHTNSLFLNYVITSYEDMTS